MGTSTPRGVESDRSPRLAEVALRFRECGRFRRLTDRCRGIFSRLFGIAAPPRARSRRRMVVSEDELALVKEPLLGGPSTAEGSLANGDVAQLVRVPDCRSGGCGFESRRPRQSEILGTPPAPERPKRRAPSLRGATGLFFISGFLHPGSPGSSLLLLPHLVAWSPVRRVHDRRSRSARHAHRRASCPGPPRRTVTEIDRERGGESWKVRDPRNGRCRARTCDIHLVSPIGRSTIESDQGLSGSPISPRVRRLRSRQSQNRGHRLTLIS